jgi:hypothetical protein
MATEFFDEWRMANWAASAAERSVLTATLGAIESGTPMPAKEDVEQARVLRGIATDLFAVALEEMAAKAGRLKR